MMTASPDRIKMCECVSQGQRFFKMDCAGESQGVSLRVICVDVRNLPDPWADATRLALSRSR